MISTLKKHKSIVTISILLLLFLVSMVYFNYKKYNVLKSSLEISIAHSIGNMTSNCYDNKKLAESILKAGKIEKNEALLFDQRDSDFISILATYGCLAEIKNKNNYVQLTVKAQLSEYGNKFAVFNENASRDLTDDDKVYLKGKILIYQVILDTSSKFFGNTKSFLENDNWNRWFKQMYEEILSLSFKNLSY